MQGFHSNAGWIYFLCISSGMILVARRMPFFSGKADTALLRIDSLNILLLPELVLLIATLLTSAMSAGFDWLYPLRVVATAMALAWCWRRFRLGTLSFHFTPVLIGIVVFLLWIGMVSASTDLDRMFAAHLAAAPAGAATAWLCARVAGAVLIVPLAEELAFRGYVIDAFSKRPPGQKIKFAWLPLLLSSLAFGLLHSEWVAGTLAGLAFGLARHLRGKIWDAVVAHATTNGLLTAFILVNGRWSYW